MSNFKTSSKRTCCKQLLVYGLGFSGVPLGRNVRWTFETGYTHGNSGDVWNSQASLRDSMQKCVRNSAHGQADAMSPSHTNLGVSRNWALAL